jgi:transcriptional regulator with XRE-family HTH domain
MAGKHLSLGAAWGLCDDSRVMAPVTDGAEISRRRKQLIWNQATLAKRAGVGLTTVVQIEKNRNVRIDGLRAVIEALDKEERKRGLAGPNLSTHPSTTASQTEGADVSQLLEARRSLARAEVFLVGALEEVRRGLAVLTEDTIERFRKIG